MSLKWFGLNLFCLFYYFLNMNTYSYEAGSEIEIFAVPPSYLEYESPVNNTGMTNSLKYALVVTVEMSMRDDEHGPQQLSDIVRYLVPLYIRILCTKSICDQVSLDAHHCPLISTWWPFWMTSQSTLIDTQSTLDCHSIDILIDIRWPTNPYAVNSWLTVHWLRCWLRVNRVDRVLTDRWIRGKRIWAPNSSEHWIYT